jgi:hypothetical protein
LVAVVGLLVSACASSSAPVRVTYPLGHFPAVPTNSHHARGQLDSEFMVDVDRFPLVIDASHMPATSKADLAELEAILASMIIDIGQVRR